MKSPVDRTTAWFFGAGSWAGVLLSSLFFVRTYLTYRQGTIVPALVTSLAVLREDRYVKRYEVTVRCDVDGRVIEDSYIAAEKPGDCVWVVCTPGSNLVAVPANVSASWAG